MDNNIIKTEDATGDNTEDKSKVEERLEKYKDVEGLSTGKLNFGLWYIKQRQHLKIALIAFLAIIGAVSWTYTIYGFAYYIARGMNEDERIVKRLVQTNIIGHDYVAQSAAQDLKYYPVKILTSNQNKYDLAVQVQNFNQKWMAEFDYYFLHGNKEVGRAKSFILPDETKYLLALAEDFTVKPATVQLMIENIRWSRINQHEISDWPGFRNEHLNITVEEIEFIPAARSALTEKTNLNQLNFKAVNKTPYNYWEVSFLILLYRGNNVVEVNKYGLADFMSQEERWVRASWPSKVGRADKVDIIPEVNIMNDDIYIKYEGGIGEEK